MEGYEFALQTYWPAFVIIGAVSVLSVVYSIFMMKKMKKDVAKFKEENPDAAKILLTTKAFITQEAVMIYSVDGEKPIKFSEKGKTGVYVKPGDRKIEVSYTYTRPGIMYRNVTKSTGAVQKEVTVEPNRTYKIGFDRKAEEFIFEEVE